MKNFTKQFTNKTLFKPTRWLLMALMMLVGTSSAWGATTYLKAGEEITIALNSAAVSNQAGWNGTNLVIWDGDGKSKTIENCSSHTITEGGWIPTGFRFESRYDWGGWKGKTSDIGDCGGKEKLQPNTMYSVTLLNETNWVGTQYQDYPNKEFKINLSCLSVSNCTPTVTNQIIIKCKSNESNVYAWVWDSDQKKYNGSTWPGDKITKIENGYLVLEITTTKDLNVIFSDGEGNQTGDITGLKVGKEYTYTYNNTAYELTNQDCIAPSCVTPTFTISGSDQICEGTNGHEYTIANPAVASGVTYAWSNNLAGVSSASATGTTYTFNTSANGAKTGTITVKATNGTCTHTETKSISQIAKPTAGTLSITSANLKINDTKTITVTGANGGTKSWSSSDPNVATVNSSGVVTAKAAGTATITYTVQPSLNGCGTAAKASATITVCANIANITATPQHIIKCGDTFTQKGQITIDKVDGLTYTCKRGNITIAVPDNGIITELETAGDYTITATNICDGTASTTVNISETQNKKTLTAISGNPLLCPQTNYAKHTFSVDPIDGAKYTWSIESPTDGMGEAKLEPSDNSVGITTGASGGGAATLKVVATVDGCASEPQTLALTQLPASNAQAATISGEASMCADATQTLTVSNALGNINPQWASSNPAVATVEANGKVTAIATGTTNITYSIESACGTRVNSNAFAITVTGTPDQLYIQRTSNSPVCAGEAITILAKANGATTYQLHREGKLDDKDVLQTIESTDGQVTFTQTEATAGTYRYVVVIKNACKRTNTAAVQVEVLSTPAAPSFTTNGEITCSGVPVSPTVSPALQGNYLVWYSAATDGTKIGTVLTSGANNSATTYYAAVSNGSCESTDRTPYTVYVESTDITNLRLYLVDVQGNELPANHVYCQGETVRFKLSYNGGKYTAYSWTQTVQANNQISGNTSLDKDNNTGAGSFTLAGVQSSGTITITLTSCNNQPIKSNDLQVTVAPVPTITVDTPSKTSAICKEYVTVTANVTNRMDGALVYWYEGSTQVGTGDEYTFTKDTPTTVNNLRAEIRNSVNCNPVSAEVDDITFEAHPDCGPSYVQGKILYFRPNGNWKEASARFAAYFYGNGNTWIDMTDGDKDGTYACEIPAGYPNVIFCRMNPSGGNDWNNKWAQTGDLTVPTDSKRLYSFSKINNNDWYPADGAWSNLGSDKTFRTIAVNGNGLWNTGGASVYAHPWSISDQSQGWFCMTPGIEAGIWLIDIETKYTDIVFERRDASGNQFDGGADKHKTADLKLDLYGNEFKILIYSGDAKTHGEWHWRWFESDYDLGVETNVVEQNGENLEIHCTGVVYKTSCAPGIKYGFEYATNKAMTNPTYVECGQGYMEAGASFEKYITVEPGEYYVRARAQYENGTIYYGWTKKVVVANNCDANYEFAVGSTSTTVQACGGNRVLPAVEIISDKNVGDDTPTWSYEWKNSDGSAATKLSATNIPSPTFNGTASQTYKVRVIKKVNDDIKCAQTAEYQVVYDDNSPKGAIEAPTTVEINQEVKLQGSINNSEGFTWMVKEGGVDVTSLMLSDATILNPTFNTKEAGVYTITLTPDNNFTCEAIPVEHTLTVSAPEEICGDNDIEVKFDFNKSKPSWFNGTDIYYTYKTNGGDCAYTSKGNDNMLNSSNPSFTIDATDLTDADFPITIYFIAQSSYNIGNETGIGYAKGSITKDDLGKLLTYNIKNDASPKSYTKIDACIDDNNTKFEANLEETEAPNVSISAPTVTSPTSIVEGTATEATLMAYLSATGCSAITAYGFQYIRQDDEPTSAAGATTKELSLPVTIGKSFKTTLENLEEGVYWFRGYATNQGGKTGYTAWSSFTIITDGPYPTLQCASGALQLLANGKIQVIVTNQGNEPVLQGSYSLNIVNQGATMAFAPLPVPAIAANSGTATFTTTNPVANKNNYSVTATLTYKGRKQQCSIKACTPQIGGGDTIFYTVDAAAVTDKCMLVFPTVYEAIDHLKASTAADGFVTKQGDGYMLKQPVVMQVVYAKDPYKGNVRVGTTGGMTDGRPEPLIISLTNINNDGNTGSGTYHPLIIRAANPNAKPALQHIAIRKSRNVTLDNLNLISSETDIDNAIDIDNNNNNWVANEIGRFANANVTVKNCLVKSKGFTCMHVSAVTKVYFINNEILADLSDDEINHANTRQWGASAKFIRCKDILFLRNNFTGTHATSVWLQGVEGALLMNNVFWNNNKISTGKTAMVRIVQQSSPEEPQNIGIYYNTMYLADCDRGADPKFDFLTLNSDEAGAINHNGDFETSSIEFMYNNCYSYDDKTPGKSTDPFKGRTPWAGLCHNNFWSVKDQNTTPAPSISAFAFGDCDVNYVNVKNNVCTTTASDPNSLVIKRSELNTGEQPNSALALKLGANLVVSDRTREDIRPTTPTIIDPDDVPSGVVDAGGNAPSIALVVSDEAGNQTMTHTIDVVTYVGATRGVEYTAALESIENFSMEDDNNGTVTVSFNKAGKTQNLTYSNNLIVSKNNVEDIVIPITGKYVASYTGGWTLGAYQQTETIATDSIIWQGSVSDDWDNRNNWLDAKTKTTLTCVNTLAKDLKVIIPAPHSENYPAPDEKGIVTYPKLPAFDTRDAQYGNEIVNAGQGDNNEPTQFADHIYMEYGAALQGVENLVDGDVRRYNEATTHLTVDREKWFLVGNMVKPFTNVNKTETRLTISGDYYIPRQEPRVYMHQITVENNMPAWQHTFAELDVTIQPTEVFAISIPDLYGSMRFNAQRYYTYVSPNPSKLGDGIVPKSYTFNGRFINESEPLTFTGLSSSPVLVNNTYPCNLSASAIENAGYTVYLYDHDKNSWVSPELDGSSKIKPQHGFAIIKKTGATTLAVTTSMLANGNTYHYEKSANATMPYHVIELYNANSTDGYASQIQVVYDAEKGAAQLDARDAEKLWSNNTMVPDLYMMMYDATLQRLYVEKPEKVIPLGVRLQQDMDVTFKMAKTNGIEKAILEDRVAGKEYDLTDNKEATITGLKAQDGNIEGRFFLNLVAEDQFNFDTPTDITDAFVETSSINIYVNNGNNLSVLANNVELQTIYVSDMSGRTQRYDVSGNYANITLPVSQGVYVVQVIGDNLTRTDKVVIK